MRKPALLMLLLCCLLAVAGCSSTQVTPNFAKGAPLDGTATPTTTPPPTPTPTPDALALAHCPQLPAAQPGDAPTAPPSLYVSRPSATDNSTILAALNANDGSTRWQETLSQEGFALSSVTVAANVVYVVMNVDTQDGILVALDAADGSQRWCVGMVPQTPNPDGSQWGKAVVDVAMNTVYVAGNEAGTVLALSAADGSVRWQALPTATIEGLAAGNGQVYVSAIPEPSATMVVIALNATDGQEAWRFQPPSLSLSLPFLVNGVVYVSELGPQDGPGFLDALSAADGSLIWRASSGSGTSLRLVAVVDGVAYGVLSTSGAAPWGVAAFSVTTGARLWEMQEYFEVGPSAGDGAAYLGYIAGTAGAVQQTVGALSATSGQWLWQVALPQSVTADEQVMQARSAVNKTFGPSFSDVSELGGTVYVSYLANSDTGTQALLLALDAKTGAQQWKGAGETLAVG